MNNLKSFLRIFSSFIVGVFILPFVWLGLICVMFFMLFASAFIYIGEFGENVCEKFTKQNSHFFNKLGNRLWYWYTMR
jgi:hypothetical protein